MSEAGAGDKSEKPSAQRLRKAREQGNIARSKDLSMAVGLLVSLKLVLWLMPSYLDDFRQLFLMSYATLESEGAQDNVWSAGLTTALVLMAKMVLPLLILPMVAVLASMVPGGITFQFGNWLPKLSRLNPMSNLGRLVSAKHYTDLLGAMGKALCLLVVLVYLARTQASDFVRLQSLSLDQALLHGAGMLLDGVITLVGVLVLFALLDLPMQYWLFMRGQRMSKQEVKEEHKQQEGRPEVRQRMRQLRRAMARRSVRQAVPQADVVIVNPEHYAVALRYDAKRAEAPYLVAKGVDEMALYIRELAQTHRVQILSLPPLARAIYNSSQVQQQIPASLYQAVAQVLGYVMQLKAFQVGTRKKAPELPVALPVPTHLSDPQ